MGFPDGSVVTNLPANEVDTGYVSLSHGLGKSPAGGNGNPSTWEIPGTEDPGGLQSMGLQRVRHDWATEHVFLVSIVKVIYFYVKNIAYTNRSNLDLLSLVTNG